MKLKTKNTTEQKIEVSDLEFTFIKEFQDEINQETEVNYWNREFNNFLDEATR